jgi:hypothetical protein
VPRIPALSCLVFIAVLLGTTFSPPALSASTGTSDPQTGRIVSDDPAGFTPNVLDGIVNSITQVGDTIVVGGTFTQVRNAGSSTTLTRNRIFAFNATSGAVSTKFVPNANGTVHTIQAAPDGTSVYVGGNFTAIAGKAVKNLARLDVATGQTIAGFASPSPSGEVRDLEVIGNRLWVAGKFYHLSGVARRALGTVNATTGAFDPYFTATFAGLHRTGHPEDLTDVLKIATNPSHTQLTAIGNFTSVNGKARSQVVRFDIGDTTPYSLSTWNTSLFTSACSTNFDTYVTDVSYSPNGAFLVVSTTGGYGGEASNTGASGCDVVARFESGGTNAASAPTWTAYTGGDTTWTVEVTDRVVYAGGHQRWQNNPAAGDRAGQGAVERTGIAALNTVNGMAYSWNPTRARGVGVKDMLATSQGLWIGSDTDLVGKVNEYHAKVAMFPLVGGNILPVMNNPTLPATIYTSASSGATVLKRRTFDGTTASTPANAPNGSIAWGSTVGAFMSNGTLYTAASNGVLTRRNFNGSTYGAASTVKASDALVPQTAWHNTDIASMGSLFFYNGRIYFTRTTQTSLFSRGFEPESDVVGQQRYTSAAVGGINYAAIRGAFVANGKFYYANLTGQLFRADWSGRAPVGGTSVQISGPGKDTQNWASKSMFAFRG